MKNMCPPQENGNWGGRDNNPLCQRRLAETRFNHNGLTFDEFKSKYLQDAFSGVFFADDALLQYQSYKEDQRFIPILCGSCIAEYKSEHEKLKKWYEENFSLFFERKITAESTFNPFEDDPDYYKELQHLFIPFYESMVVLLSRGLKKEGHSPSILVKYILKKNLVDLRRLLYTDKNPDKNQINAANPDFVDIASSTFDTGSGLFIIDLFFLIRDRYILSDLTHALKTHTTTEAISRYLERYTLMVTPWKHQDEAIQKWLHNQKSGIVEMATATGKTVVGLMAIEKLWNENNNGHVLIICHRTVILNQWRREIIEKFGLLDRIARDYKNSIQSGNFRISFETIQTIMNNPENFQADLLIIDEVHHIIGNKYRRALDLPHRYRLGLTAQIDDNELKSAIKGQFGDIIFRYNLLEALKDGIIPEFKWIVHPVFLNIKEADEFKTLSSEITKLFNYAKNNRDIIQRIIKNPNFTLTTIGDFIYLTQRARYSGVELPDDWKRLQALLLKRRWIIHRSGPRLEKVIHFIEEMINRHKIIVFLMDTESCDFLSDKLKKNHQNVFSIHSKIKGDPIEVVNQFRQVANGVLLGVEMLNEGIDIPNADIGINVAFTKTQIQLVQRMGRILRKDGDKKPTFYQFVAIPDRTVSLDEIDVPDYIDDLAWLKSTARKMGLDLEIVLDDDELKSYKSEAETFIRTCFQLIDSDKQSIGSFNFYNTIKQFDEYALHRLLTILDLYDGIEISDKQWEDIIQTAYSIEKEDGTFEKIRFVDVGNSWYILIIANRSGNTIKELIKDNIRFTNSEERPLPKLHLNNEGLIEFEFKPVSSLQSPPSISTITSQKTNADVKEDLGQSEHIKNYDNVNKCNETEKSSVFRSTSDNYEMYGEISTLLSTSLDYFKKQDTSNAIDYMRRVLEIYPHDRIIELFIMICNEDNKRPIDILSPHSTGKFIRIPDIEDITLSIKDSKKWIQAYNKGAIDTAIHYYRNNDDNTNILNETKTKDLYYLEIMKSNIYLLKLFVLECE